MTRCAIIGAGISGLSAAHWLQQHSRSLTIDVYDAASEVGGLMQTEIVDGCIVDAGPDSFLTQKQPAWDLIDALDLRDAVIGSNDAARRTFIYHEGGLQALPEGFFLMVPSRWSSFLRTNLLSWAGKLDALGDLFASPESEDLTVADFIESRFGTEILDRIAEPLLAGIYGADLRYLSLRSALPQIWEMQKKGSLIRQLRQLPAKSESLFTTFRGGMQTLAAALREKCDRVNWKLGVVVDEIARDTNSLWVVDGQPYEAVVVACSKLPAIHSEYGVLIASMIASIPRNHAIVIALGFTGVHREGFGWLIPQQDRRSVLACTYVSNKFRGRTPPDRFLVRLFIGSKHAPDWIRRPDDEISGEALRELQRVAGITAEPLFSRVYRWFDAMPEYRPGHIAKIQSIEEWTKLEGNLFLTGNLFEGVGIPYCIAHARKTAANVLTALPV